MALALIASLFIGCGAASKGDYMSNGSSAEMAPGAPAEGDYEMSMDSSLTDSSMEQPDLPDDRKFITTVHMDAETEDLDVMLSSLNSKIAQLGGYIETQELYNGSTYSSHRYRRVYMTIRIPAENLNQFTEQVAEEMNVVNSNTTLEDVTLSYVAIESRIAVLETEQARLMELLSQAENMSDLLMIESRLTEVTAELEQVTSQLRVMANKVNYSTVRLNLQEVKEYTEVVEPETFWQRVTKGFSDNLADLWDGIVEFVIFLLTGIPYFALIGAIAVGVVFLIKRIRRKKAAKKAKAQEEQNPQ
jgi:hypothetical protein